MANQTKGNRKQKKRIGSILVLALMMVLSTSVFSFADDSYTLVDRNNADSRSHAGSEGNGSHYCVFSNDITLSRSDVRTILEGGGDIADFIVRTSGLCFHKSDCSSPSHQAMTLAVMNKEPNVYAELIVYDEKSGFKPVEPSDLQPFLNDTLYTKDETTGDKSLSVYFDVRITENGRTFTTIGKSQSRGASSGEKRSLIKLTVTVTGHFVTVHNEEQPPEVTTLYEGEEYVLPTVEKQGFELVGWFTDAELTVPFDPATVTTDVDIYPKWQEKAVAPPVAGQGGEKKEEPKAAAVSSGDKGDPKSGAEVAGEEEVALMAGGGDVGEAPKIKVKGNVITKTMDKGLLNFSVPTVNIPFKGISLTAVEGKEKIDLLGLGLVSAAGLVGLLFALTIASDMRVIRWFRRKQAQLQ